MGLLAGQGAKTQIRFTRAARTQLRDAVAEVVGCAGVYRIAGARLPSGMGRKGSMKGWSPPPGPSATNSPRRALPTACTSAVSRTNGHLGRPLSTSESSCPGGAMGDWCCFNPPATGLLAAAPAPALHRGRPGAGGCRAPVAARDHLCIGAVPPPSRSGASPRVTVGAPIPPTSPVPHRPSRPPRPRSRPALPRTGADRGEIT